MAMIPVWAAKGGQPGPWHCHYEDDAPRQGIATKKSWHPYQGRHPRRARRRSENSDLGGRYSLARHVLPHAPDGGTKTLEEVIVSEVRTAD
jgi:hypothetical protein